MWRLICLVLLEATKSGIRLGPQYGEACPVTLINVCSLQQLAHQFLLLADVCRNFLQIRS